MTDSKDTADIAWLRDLAEQGASHPMRGGEMLMAAGLIFGAASLVHAAVTSGMIDLPPSVFSYLWIAATALYMVVLFFFIHQRRREGGVRTAVDRATRAVWSAVGWGIFAMFTSIGVIAARIGEPSLFILSLAPSIIMVFYGLGWAVSAAMTRSRPIGALAVASFLAAPLLAALPNAPVQYLGYAAALFLLMAVPGWLLMRAARQG